MEAYRTRAIVLSLIKYSENRLILHLLTRDSGRQSFITYASRRNGSRRNIFQPLQIIDFKAQKPRANAMPSLADVIVEYPLLSIYTNPMKSTMAMFIGEILYRMVTEPLDDNRMYEFVEKSVLALETMDQGVVNFHLWFLVRFAARMGWALPEGHSDGFWLDIKNGMYTPLMPGHPQRVAPRYCETIERVRHLNMDELHTLVLSREDRRNVLDALIDYYRFHSNAFREMNSVSMFAEIF